MASPVRIAVVGGGISGLATAHFLSRGTSGGGQEAAPTVVVVESANQLGGKISTCEVAGLSVDAGPDSLAPRPILRALLDELGLSDRIVAAAPLGSCVWSRGKLRKLPSGTFFGIPDRVLPVMRSGLLSPSGLLRASLDTVRPRQALPEDATIAQLLRPRFGRQLVERLVDPLVGGIQAGNPNTLSAQSTVPDVDKLVRANRSVFLALQRRRRAAARVPKAANGGPTGGVIALDGGLVHLVDALAATFDPDNVFIGSPATKITRTLSGFRVHLGGLHAGREIIADAVVLATPAFATADLLQPLAAELATELRDIPYLDVATLMLAYPADAISRPFDTSGFVVPSCEHRLVVGSTLVTAKWPHLAGDSVAVFKVMVGRADDARAITLDDAALTRLVHAELADAVGLTAGPQQVVVRRWPKAIPQYTVGHHKRLQRIDELLAEIPGLYVTGAAYRGASTTACLAEAARIAELIRRPVTEPEPSRVA